MRFLSTILFALGLLSAGLTAAPAQDVSLAAQIATDRATSLDSRLSAMKVEQRWTFGTGGTVRNTRDLAKDFEAFQAWVGPISIGSELQRYQPFTAPNFAFAPDRLDLVGRLDTRKWRSGVATATATVVGEPVVRNGVQIVTIDAWPAIDIDGAAVGTATPNMALARKGDYRVTGSAKAARMVVVHPPNPDFRDGAAIRFVPPITSAQIWTKSTVPLGQGRTVAVDATVVLPDASARGAWPAFWLYAKVDGTNRSNPYIGQELDFEVYKDGVRDNWWNGQTHPLNDKAVEYLKDDAGWRKINAFYTAPPFKLEGEIRYSYLIEPDRVLRYVNDELVKIDRITWKAPPPQIAFNLAIGNLKPDGTMADRLAPRSGADFAGMRFGVKSLTVYVGP